MDEVKVVLVTGIGGNVGQGIIRNVRVSGFNIRVIGTNVEDFSAGNHLCDLFYKVPYAYEASYLEEMKGVVEKENVDLIIPATDYEVYYLSKYQQSFTCEIAVSAYNTASMFLDKFLTFKFFQEHDIPFANSFLPSAYDNSLEDIIAKPRKGRGSRGLLINPLEINQLSDFEYMVQELIVGTEITTAFYVNREKKFHGKITFERTLENGTTQHCRVINEHDQALNNLIYKIIAVTHIKGAANIQSIVTDQGKIIPFEINCRISGTNSIRSNFGFKDVQYTLEEWLYKREASKAKITKGVATRILMDVIYPEIEDFQQAKNNTTKHHLF